MHVCFICHEFPKEGILVGGIGFFLKTYTRLLLEHDISVSVVGFNNSQKTETEEADHFQIIRIGRSKVKFISWLINGIALNRTLKAIHQSHPIHIIEAPELDLAFIRKQKGIRYLIRLHGGHHFFAEAEKRKINWWKGFQERISFQKADAFIAVSEYVKNHTFKYFPLGKRPIAKIFGMIDIDRFLNGNVPERNPFEIVFAGTVCEKKGVRPLIEAVHQLKDDYPEISLKIYGREWFFPDGKSYTDFLFEKLPETYFDHVTFMGPVAHDKLPEIFSKAQICAFPSFMETQGLVVSEAMASSGMVIYTALGPGKELVSHGVNGFLVNPYDTADLSKTIRSCLALGFGSEYHGICKEAHDFVNQEFDTKKLVKENINFYKKIWSESNV